MSAVAVPLFQTPKFPETRYMGSKRELLGFIWEAVEHLRYRTVLDAFSGSGCVAYMFKAKGKGVTANDHLSYAFHIANATVANNTERLDEDDIEFILRFNPRRRRLIERTFRGLYFSDEENRFLDNASANVREIGQPFKQSLAIAALCRACIKRRARGVFTYVGNRYDDGRRDLRLSLREHFLRGVDEFNAAVFDNGQRNLAYNEDIFDLSIPRPDLVYIDPPYVTPLSDNDYLRRYHFVEGLSSYWAGSRIHILAHTKTKKLRKYPTLFDRKSTIHDAFERLFDKFRSSILAVSYSSNSIPSRSEMKAILRNFKQSVEVRKRIHTYSFGTHAHKVNNGTNRVEEYLFVGV